MESLSSPTTYISITIAIITALITSLINWVVWSLQFIRKEESEYRRLYQERRLNVYSKLHEMLLGDMIDVLCAASEGKPVPNTRELLSKHFVQLSKFFAGNQFFISNQVIRKFRDDLMSDYGHVLHAIGDKDLKKKIETYFDTAHSLKDMMCKELGLDVLDKKKTWKSFFKRG